MAENWKHCSKIIFKCVNGALGPNFNENFAEKSTCGSREQCTEPTHLDANAAEYYFQLYPNIGYKEKTLNIEKQYKNIPES